MSAQRQEPSAVARIGHSCPSTPTLIRIDRRLYCFDIPASIFQPSTTNFGFTDSTHRRFNAFVEETRITCSNGLRLQGGVQFPTGGIARERLQLQGQQIWWNSRADGIVRMKEDVSIDGHRRLPTTKIVRAFCRPEASPPFRKKERS
jgi:hypothetical protein